MNQFLQPTTPFEFSTSKVEFDQEGTYLVGFEFDGTACFRKGTKLGPNALRDVSYGIESYSPYLNRDLESKEDLFDLGNIPIPQSYNNIDEAYHKANGFFFSHIPGKTLGITHKIITIGGEHSISFAPIKSYLKQFDDLVLIHLDAHADLRDGYEGHHYSHASIIRRVLDHFKNGHQLIQYGIRSGTREEFEWMNKHHTLAKSRQFFLERVSKIADQRPIYLTLDLDYFDPSFFPGTGTPEPGGEDFHSFISLIKVLKNKNFVGADIVELAPNIDSTGNSSVFAAKVVREISLAMRND